MTQARRAAAARSQGKAKKATAALSQLRHAQASMVAAATQKLQGEKAQLVARVTQQQQDITALQAKVTLRDERLAQLSNPSQCPPMHIDAPRLDKLRDCPRPHPTPKSAPFTQLISPPATTVH